MLSQTVKMPSLHRPPFSQCICFSIRSRTASSEVHGAPISVSRNIHGSGLSVGCSARCFSRASDWIGLPFQYSAPVLSSATLFIATSPKLRGFAHVERAGEHALGDSWEQAEAVRSTRRAKRNCILLAAWQFIGRDASPMSAFHNIPVIPDSFWHTETCHPARLRLALGSLAFAAEL